MKKRKYRSIATTIQSRAYKLNISISEVCRKAGVSRRWFENLKRREPESVDALLSIWEYLAEQEKKNNNNNQES